ncbi:putative baseplate assembly protein [Kovacikia minuta CCNUW1]|uniref:putative baseplate assembly protein n=1 Tax=Kovacikia minuta TaxID=2931930 RepID=UPI001CCF1568|nr:putative baseplate assembly protein [Kovacikia minuta]UBF28586.1 putative baseplate assembly protein [Kovacikia minuta CCNUW1]
MPPTLYHCKNEQRRVEVLTKLNADGSPIVNGIDYLEVSADQKTLLVHLIHPFAGEGLSEGNVLIQGGIRRRDVRAESTSAFGTLLTVRVNASGDLSPYTLRLVQSLDNPRSIAGFDPQLSQVEFRFQVADLSEFDCQLLPAPADKPPPPPAIDYLAKDYASFRQLMLDRLTITLPQWKERNPADLGVMLVELVAYAGDYLSYYQDAAATEAYLGTARKRVSVRRHARLLNYPMHDGCNARGWVALQVSSGQKEGMQLFNLSTTHRSAGIKFLTRSPGLPAILTAKEFDTALNAGAQVFEPLGNFLLHAACNLLLFYTWGDTSCQLPRGETRATLIDPDGTLKDLLMPGKMLIFEEVKGAKTGLPVDADPTHRHVVRLTHREAQVDPLYEGIRLLEIEWAMEDALPFPMVISAVVDDRPIQNISVIWGNVVMVDQGCSVSETFDPVPAQGRFRPRLQKGPLTQQRLVSNRNGALVPFDPDPEPSLGTAVLLQRDLQDVQPAIYLQEQEGQTRWQPQRDLLNSDRFARDFVVETEDDGRAYLRFGDNVLGRHPEPGTVLQAHYRIGNGQAGNVGAEAIAHIFLPDPKPQTKNWLVTEDELKQQANADLNNISVRSPIRNPLPTKGGIEPEPIEQVRLYAPQAFRTQQRAVTEKDYADITQRFPTVRKALATRRWTGSWYTLFITVDRENGLPVDDAFKQELSTFLEQFRLTAQDFQIEAPRFIPLDISLSVKVLPGYFPDQIKKTLLETFSNTVQPDGRLGFFHPDNFSFGQPVYLSQVIEQAMQVKGVQSVLPTRFQRLGLLSLKELERGQIAFAPLEIARLDNEPNSPEQGRILFEF